MEDGWPWATIPPHNSIDKLHSLEIFLSSSPLFYFRTTNPTNKYIHIFFFFFLRKGLFNIKATHVQELAGFLEVELSHGVVLDALCSRKSLIFGDEGAGGSLPSPLPSSAEALTASGQAGRDARVKASCLPPLVRGMATEQVAMENRDYSAPVCTGWGGIS